MNSSIVRQQVDSSVVRQQVDSSLDLHFKDSSAFAIGFFYLQFARVVFCIFAVCYDDRVVYESRRCLYISILFVLIFFTICVVGLL